MAGQATQLTRKEALAKQKAVEYCSPHKGGGSGGSDPEVNKKKK